MKHHSKFKVSNYLGGKVLIEYARLGVFTNRITDDMNIVDTEAVTLSTENVEKLLNAAYDEGYEKGRQAVRNCMNEAMGFDGE